MGRTHLRKPHFCNFIMSSICTHVLEFIILLLSEQVKKNSCRLLAFTCRLKRRLLRTLTTPSAALQKPSDSPSRGKGPARSSRRKCSPGRSCRRSSRSGGLWGRRLSWSGLTPAQVNVIKRLKRQEGARRGAARLTLYFSKYPRYLMTLTHTSSVEVPRKMLHTS